jgi:hypothetical protein
MGLTKKYLAQWRERVARMEEKGFAKKSVIKFMGQEAPVLEDTK